ncbi:class II histone deacetylase [Brevirhabdus pacifica]|uniref:Class II histone deacetylase n=1 Tax=Brevirhabdus pacifica TaxID=1267768 RepID=A0A1U7DKF4_9RHOB|nr:class II histone deacetylase [Brevirhabdus pacifica]APX90405.1 class II histone deacetylase [Brevirhabdus pacifica]OWU78571.1 acetoin utilization protein [Loktanella sp. 22II-4b]PJJ85505.1 acetoin utilization deacetylase AcuC-like enzyme [Brevirhabdus pacifica]
MKTGFFYDELCFWHSGGNYAFTMQVGGPGGGLVQPSMGGLPENPETKRRLKNLVEVTGLMAELDVRHGQAATEEELARVHPRDFLNRFRALSNDIGGELGLRTPFAKGGFDIAALSAGLARSALFSVLRGQHDNAYALSRPPGHHCLPEFPNGFCLLANIAIAIEAALAEGLTERIAVVDWDVHHGNGTEAIFYDRDDVLTISVHQDRNYPIDTGDAADIGAGRGEGFNMNIPLPAGSGHATYMAAMDHLVIPALERFQPDAIIVACGFDAAAVDPLGRMLCTAETFRAMTERMVEAADLLCAGRLTLVHEGGYSEAYVPFCGHAVLAEMSGSAIRAPDPLADMFAARQPRGATRRFLDAHIDELRAHFF